MKNIEHLVSVTELRSICGDWNVNSKEYQYILNEYIAQIYENLKRFFFQQDDLSSSKLTINKLKGKCIYKKKKKWSRLEYYRK